MTDRPYQYLLKENNIMIENFKFPDDDKYHQYCLSCFSEQVERRYRQGKTFYFCMGCKKTNTRSLVIDPKVVWWLDSENQYWHESVGVFVFNSENKILFFERTIYPFAFTIPAGHLDIGEDTHTAAIRELVEETQIAIENLDLFSIEDIVGDKCRRGSDLHKWNVYTAQIEKTRNINICDEGKNPVWMSIDEALKKELTYPVRFLLQKYKKSFERKYLADKSVKVL